MTTSAPRQPIELTPGQPVDRIVVPVTLEDRYERGVSAAATLAERFDLPLHLVSVEISESKAVGAERTTAMITAVDALKAAHPSLVVTHDLLAVEEHPAAAFSAPLRVGDLPVIATRAMDGPEGSFAQETVGLFGGPVLMLGPDASLPAGEGDVVVGVDGSVLAERIVPAARGLAAALGGNLKLVHIVPSAVTAHVEKLRQRGQQVSENAYVQDLCERLDSPSITWEIIHHDDPAVALANLAARTRPAALAMATHGRDGFVAQVFGSVTQDAVRAVACPVLVQRPVGVTSPKEI